MALNLQHLLQVTNKYAIQLIVQFLSKHEYIIHMARRH